MNLDRPVWQMGRGRYQAMAGVKRPYIMEISETQYARMSKRARREYNAKRDLEWEESAACARQYERDVVAAWNRGEFKLSHPDLHGDARSAVYTEIKRVRDDEWKMRLEHAREKNAINASTPVDVGARVYSLMHSLYGEVVRTWKRSVRIRFPRPLYDGGPAETTVRKAALLWKHDTDLRLDLEEEMRREVAK